MSRIFQRRSRVKPDSGYGRTLYDRLGPEAADIQKTFNYSMIPAAGGAGIGIALAIRNGMGGGAVLASAVAGAVIAGGGAALFITAVSQGMGAGFGEFIQPSGGTTPYEEQYSQEEAMVARGDVEAALASYERLITERPLLARPRLRAAELNAAGGRNRERAEALYREVQGLKGGSAQDDVYASNRLVDLYRSWPGRESRALRELRRLIDRYPGGEVATRARAGLLTLKRDANAGD